MLTDNVKLTSFPAADELAAAAAGAWLDEIATANRNGQTHFVALSGGRIARKFYADVVNQATARAVSLERVHFFWGDERCVKGSVNSNVVFTTPSTGKNGTRV